MSYVKKTWTAGQKVKSADLNNMEGGIDAAANPFVVTLTPTAQDFSGTMDKTVAEINTAYEAGRKIVFHVLMGLTEYIDIDVTAVYNAGNDYPSFNAYTIEIGNNILIYAYTEQDAVGTDTDYHTIIYPLTPMS